MCDRNRNQSYDMVGATPNRETEYEVEATEFDGGNRIIRLVLTGLRQPIFGETAPLNRSDIPCAHRLVCSWYILKESC